MSCNYIFSKPRRLRADFAKIIRKKTNNLSLNDCILFSNKFIIRVTTHIN